MNRYQELFNKAISIQYQVSESDKKPKSFGTNELMYQSEIHFIDAMGINDGVSAQCMVNKLRITNGAVTQITDKLIKRGMIEKFKKVDNKKSVYYRLTSQGKTAYYGHKEFHNVLNEKVIQYMEKMTEEQFEGLLGLLEVVEQNLPNSNK